MSIQSHATDQTRLTARQRIIAVLSWTVLGAISGFVLGATLGIIFVDRVLEEPITGSVLLASGVAGGGGLSLLSALLAVRQSGAHSDQRAMA